jgi:dTDP-4-amino-4,6-dideoxygalactose transaminase
MSTAIPAVRTQFLPYCLPMLGEEEIAEVVDSLRSGWITTGPKVKRFEEDFARYVGAKHAIAVSSCTAATHIALAALNIGPGDEVIVPTLTFCATANVVVHTGARPVLVDVGADFQIDIAAVERAITPRTKAIIPVHYAGIACDIDELHELACRHKIPVIEDAAHAAGTEYKGRRIGSHSMAVAFSFYATKNLATGEGGMITTNDDDFAARMRLFSLHGMNKDAWKRYSQSGSWYYEVLEAGFKNNMTDIQASLGIHQLRKLDHFNAARYAIAQQYNRAFANLRGVTLPGTKADRNHTYHLYPIQLGPDARITRDAFIDRMKEQNIGTSVHFIPVHRHPFYRDHFCYSSQQFPMAEKLFSGLVSLPLYPKMTPADVEDVIEAVGMLLA